MLLEIFSMKKTILILLCFLFSSSLFAYDFNLFGVETGNNSVVVYRGKSMQTVADDNFLISMLATKTDNGIQFSTSITNYSSEDYFFKEYCISVYQGIYENNSWEQIKYIPASLYFIQAKQKAKSEEIAAAIALGLTAASSGYSKVKGSGYVDGHRYTYTANVYSPADAAIATSNSYIALDNLQQNNQEYLSYLENNLLFDSLIPANENYNGIFIVNEKKGPDYKVIFEFSPTEIFEFYFTRSDKDEILNPWKDKQHSRHSVIASVSPMFNHFGLYYLWSRPKGVGVYTGLSYSYNCKNVPIFKSVSNIDYIYDSDMNYLDPENSGNGLFTDWKFDVSNSLYDSIGMYLGMTIKTFPNTWFLLGCGIDFETKKYSYGKLYYKIDMYPRHDKTYTYYKDCWLEEKYPSDVYFTPQIGLNFIANMIDVGAIFSYPIKGKPAFDLTIGYSF